MDVIATRMPDFLWVHFHGIDDLGHLRPDAVEVDHRMTEGWLRAEMVNAPRRGPSSSSADHGMHAVSGRQGTMAPARRYPGSSG